MQDDATYLLLALGALSVPQFALYAKREDAAQRRRQQERPERPEGAEDVTPLEVT